MSTMGGNVVMNGYYSTADAKKPELKAGFKTDEYRFCPSLQGTGYGAENGSYL